MTLLIIKSLWLFLPIGVANMAPVLVKGVFKNLDKAIDGGRTWRGKPLLGDHKTWRGLLAAVLFGGVVFWLQQLAAKVWPEALAVISLTDYRELPVWSGAVLGLGAIVGDAVKSFFKRRIDIGSGKSWKPFDQIDYIIGGLVAATFVMDVPAQSWLWLLIIGFGLHILTNHIGFWLGMREEKW